MTFSDLFIHLFIPHESNNHKSKLLHSNLYLFYILFFIFFGVGLKVVKRTVPNILGIATNISVNDLLENTNQQRVNSGLAPLSLNTQLSQAAQDKALDMFKDNYWAHFGPNGKSPWNFIQTQGYRYSYAGENLAKDFNDSSGVVNAWMNSNSHKDNILKPEYKDIGFAIVNGTLNGQETTLVVQMFGTPSQSQQIIADNNSVLPTVVSTVIVKGVNKTPLFNISFVNKSVSLFILGLLIIVLVLDGLVIWQRKTLRISGHNFAHIIFLLAIIAVIWLTGTGAII